MKKLNFACGNDFKKGWDNCDIQKGKDIISFDMTKFPYPFEDNTYDYILAKQCSGYCLNEMDFFMELWRIAKPNAILEFENTWYHNKGAFSIFGVCNHGASDTQYHYLAEPLPYDRNFKRFFELVEIKYIPLTKYIPLWILLKLDVFLSGMIRKINVKMKVVK